VFADEFSEPRVGAVFDRDRRLVGVLAMTTDGRFFSWAG
jgi:hypothetical protein